MGMLDSIVEALRNVPLQEAIPGGAGTTPQGDPTLLSSMAARILNTPKQAIQGAAYDVANPGSSEAVGPATDAAMMVMGGGMPMAERGALGMAGGRIVKPGSMPVREPPTIANPTEERLSLVGKKGASEEERRAIVKAQYKRIDDLNTQRNNEIKKNLAENPIEDNIRPRSPTNYIDELVGKYNSGSISSTEGWILKRLLKDRYQ